ncbi:MAG: serine/threonine protein kinase [Propionibacteriaceae bacterium]|jgi:hypothetical protein|nr:serine/threonine protein kinase [Propionibacteriaceae bacterium]
MSHSTHLVTTARPTDPHATSDDHSQPDWRIVTASRSGDLAEHWRGLPRTRLGPSPLWHQLRLRDEFFEPHWQDLGDTPPPANRTSQHDPSGTTPAAVSASSLWPAADHRASQVLDRQADLPASGRANLELNEAELPPVRPHPRLGIKPQPTAASPTRPRSAGTSSPVSPTTVRPPSIGGLTPVKLISVGPFADTFLYVSGQSRLPVAVKVWRSPLDSQQAQSFAVSGSIAASLHHPQIVRLFTTGQTDDGRHYAEMAYYPHGSLDRITARGPQPAFNVIRVGLSLANALGQAHQAHLLHGNIKPTNVLLDQDWQPVLTDFGIAHPIIAPSSTPSPTDGDSPYLSWSPPEAIGQPTWDERSDIYSLAATLWHLLAGRPPFVEPAGDNSAAAVSYRITHQSVSSLSHLNLPSGLEDLLHRSLAKNSDQRPTGAADFSRQLNEILRRMLG